MRTSLTIAIATVMIGLAVSQARADRVGYTIDRCFGASCVGGSVKVGELSLAFTESSLGVIDSAASSTALGNFAPELGGVSGTSFAGAAVNQGSAVEGSAAQRANAVKANPTAVLLPGSGMSLAFSRMEVPAFATSIDLARSVSTAGTGSFSVTGASLNASKGSNPYWSNGLGIGGAPGGNPGGQTAVPEPTTMLLFGTGLAGAAALVRRHLKKAHGAN
jgi:hypothetical protein